MKKDWKSIVKKIYELVGKDKNIKAFTNCQTRLRINVFDINIVDLDSIKKIDGVLGINVAGDQVQIIFGTGNVVKAAEAFGKIVNILNNDEDLAVVAKKNKMEQKSKNQSSLQRFVSKFSGIFAPMIIGFIGAGILAGIAGIIKSSYGGNMASAPIGIQSLFNVLDVLMTIWKGTFLIIVGWRTAEVFGGSGVIGAIIAGIYVVGYSTQVDKLFVKDGSGFNLLGIHIQNPDKNWLTVGLRPSIKSGIWGLSYPSGAIFGVMMSSGIIGLIEKGIRKFMPPVIDTVGTPTLSLLALLVLNLVLIFPISGYIFKGVSFMFENLYGNPFGAALLGALFLVTVIFGIHQGFVPVYVALMAKVGVNSLFPVLAMSGAGQVGMAIALWLRAEKNGLLRKQIQGAIIPGFLGIGEPLIYGVSLPRPKTFIAACFGGAMGGLFLGFMNLTGDQMGLNSVFGPSGLLALPMITTVSGIVWKGILIYIGGLAISYASGFMATYYLGYKNVDLA